LRSALSVAGGAASLGKLGALSKPTLGGLAGYGTFSDGQDIGAAITGTDMQGNSLDAMERLKRGGMGVLGAVDLAGPGGRYPLTPESHGGVGGKSIPGHDRLNNFDNRAENPQKSPELAKATVPTKVGEIDHEVMPRQTGDKIEIWVCSHACDNVTAKIDDMLTSLPNEPAHQKLREELLALRQEVEALKPRLETGKNPDGNFWEHSEISKVTGQIAKRFQELGQQHPVVGKALNEPSQIANALRTDRQTRTFSPSAKTVKIMQKQGLDPETRLVYTVRDKETGAVLKPGETQVETSDKRFRNYAKAANATDLEIEIEVTPIPQAKDQSEAKSIEYRLRDNLEGQGNIMPWDNENSRLGRQGPGTPFEPLPAKKTSRLRREGYEWNKQGHLTNEAGEGTNIPRLNAAIPEEQLRALMIKYKGKKKEIAAALNMDYETLRRQMIRAKLYSEDFKDKSKNIKK
jgi:hypothetical protein